MNSSNKGKRKRRRAKAPPLWQAAVYVLAIISPLLFGGAFGSTVVAIAALSLTCLFVGLYAYRDESDLVQQRIFADRSVWFFVGALAFTAIQAMPLPLAFGETIGHPNTTAISRLREFSTTPISWTISLDPGGTQTQTVILIAVLSAFCLGRLGGRRAPRIAARAIAVSAACVALVSLAHTFAGLDKVYGVYAPRFTSTRIISPLMNHNHLAGFLSFGAIVSLGLALDPNETNKRGAWTAVAIINALVCFSTLSRGGIASMIFGLSGLMLLRSKRAKSDSNHTKTFGVVLVVASAVGVALYTYSRPLLQRFPS
ncbi:MAG: hypothetical protein R3A47_07195 [Polyangiales bacterium]